MDTIADFGELTHGPGRAKPIEKYGADGENRTLTGLPPPDFESGASASSTTSARC